MAYRCAYPDCDQSHAEPFPHRVAVAPAHSRPDDSAAFGDAVARAVKRAIADAYFDAACAYIEPGDPGFRYEAS